jgi:two-component system sensor histidine kinase KdpD
MDKQRPNPDELLARVQAEEQSKARGQLKIFLGYVAGVGKTYAMLEAAHQRRAAGVDVVAAYVETHKRVETEELLRGLEVLPRQQIDHRGVMLPEMDLDAVLARHPQLALVDELAHTNAPGSRHPKRYLDVQELLDAGIDVYSTLNIQHLESLNDVVAQITGVSVRETIPDKVIDEASEIELIDLPPDELVQRLREGKVYVPDQAARAIEEFFRKGNLTALRELALRRTAKRVDDQMRAYMRTRSIPGPWPASDRLLVCISSHPLSERLVRTGCRLADQLNAEWFVLNVETPGYSRLSSAQRDQLARTMRLAEELGARTRSLPGNSVAETVLAYARRHNVTKLIVGESLQPRLKEMLRGSIVDQLLRQSGRIDVYVMSSESDAQAESSAREWIPHRPFLRYIQSILLVGATTVIGAIVRPVVTAPTNLVMIYLASVVIAALYLGRGPSLLAAFLSVLAFDFFFVPPQLTFAVTDTEYLLTFLGLFIVSLVISTLAVRSREQADAAHDRESETAALYAFSRALAAAVSLDEIVSLIITHLSENFSREVVVLLPENSHLDVSGHSPDTQLGDNEMAVAVWAYQRGEPAGRDTDTLPAARVRCLPLKTAHGVIGVLGVMPHDSTKHLTPEQRRLMEAYASQAAVAIERAQLVEQTRQTQVLQATEILQTALLNSISHDLRTPLVSITGALSSLQEDGTRLDETTRLNLIDTARDEAERLNRLVGNLLDMTRLEAGAMKIRSESCDVQDVIGSALDRLSDQIGDRQVQINIVPDLPLVPMDFVLMVQVLVNLLDNATKYSPPGSPIDIDASHAGAFAEITVADRGVGIPRDDLTRVFDKFYRVQHPGNAGGTGLGLSICKGIVEAHGGFIGAENRPGGGTIITIGLPLTQPLAERGEAQQ